MQALAFMIKLSYSLIWEIALFSDLNQVQVLIQNDSGLTLLTKKNAPFIISFLYKIFKDETIDNGIEQKYFVQQLDNYISSFDDSFTFDEENTEDSDTSTIEINNFNKAFNLTKKWSETSNGFIFRYYNEDNIEMVELSTSVNRLFRYFEDIEGLKNMFIGTESKFLEVLDRIKELDHNTIKNPKARIDELQKQKQKIEAEISKIEETGNVETYSHIQVAERVESLNKVSKTLLADFKQLKDNNHKLFSDLCKKQLETSENRGTILSHILDQTEALQRTPQGESFNAFWYYLSQQNDEDTIKNKINRVKKRLPNQKIDTEFFNSFEQSLYLAGKNVLEENRLLSEKLKRIITKKTSPEYKYISTLTKDIKTLCMNNDILKPMHDEILIIEGYPTINNDMARPLDLINRQLESTQYTYNEGEIPRIDYSQLIIDIYVNEIEIQENLEQVHNYFLNNSENMTVQYIFDKYPINYGLAEVLTYLSLLFKAKWITLDTKSQEIITYTSYEDKSKISLSIPKVVINNE
jgi:hypothetical protein